MKKIFILLFIMTAGVVTTSCVNMFAVKELNEAAADYMNKGDVKSAIARLESSVDLDGNVPETRYNLSVAYLQVKECKKALEHIDFAIKLAKQDDANMYYTKAVVLSCLADEAAKNKKLNENEKIDYLTEVAIEQDTEQELSYLKEANTFYAKYLELSPNALDASEIQSEIARNEEEISKITGENKSDE